MVKPRRELHRHFSVNKEAAEEFAACLKRKNWLLNVALFLGILKMRIVPIQSRTARRLELHYYLFWQKSLSLKIRKDGREAIKFVRLRPIIIIRVPGTEEKRKVEGA